jgi:rRNA processing protein Gar1
MVFRVHKTSERIPKFNAPVFLENKTVIGTIDEIFGAVNDVVCAFFIFIFCAVDLSQMAYDFVGVR